MWYVHANSIQGRSGKQTIIGHHVGIRGSPLEMMVSSSMQHGMFTMFEVTNDQQLVMNKFQFHIPTRPSKGCLIMAPQRLRGVH